MEESNATYVPAPPPTLSELFLAFLKIGILGFGGVGPIARHIVVVERAWLDDQDYATLLGICQALPGANTVNSAVMLGDRFRGPMGAVVSLLGLMTLPLVVLVALASLYDAIGSAPLVQAALTGAAAAAAGLILGTACTLLMKARPTTLGWIMSAAALIAVGVFRAPLVWVIAGLVPTALLATLALGRSR